MQDSPGHPEQNGIPPTPQAAPTVAMLSTAQAAAQLGNVNPRTVRRWIDEGIQTANGVVKLVAREVHGSRGRQLQIAQTDLDAFKATRDRAATEGQPAGDVQRAEEAQTQALTLSYQIIAAELERRNQALIEVQRSLSQAQETIERLAREAGRSEGLERELELTHQRVIELQQERDYWQTKAKKSYRIRLFPITEE